MTITARQDSALRRRRINPWDWQDAFGYSQAIHLRNVSETLIVSGQGSLDPEGAPLHQGDMAAQLALTIENIESVLEAAGFDLASIDRLDVFTTDVDSLLANWGPIAARLVDEGCIPAVTLIGVERLAFPELLVEVEVTAHR